MAYLIGADPEVFVENDNGVFINGHGLVPGDKMSPFRVDQGAVQVDGMALEFNIEPAETREEFVSNVQGVMAQLEAMVQNGRLSAKSIMKFTPEFLKNQPEESVAMGCEPDYDAWTLAENEPPDQGLLMRTAAGHIHIGWTEGEELYDVKHRLKCAELVRHLDNTVGLWTVIEDPGSAERRSMYGRAGCHRVKPYGVEYRVPSNFWIAGRSGEMYDRITNALQMFDDGDIRNDSAVIDIINNSDVEAAKGMLAA